MDRASVGSTSPKKFNLHQMQKPKVNPWDIGEQGNSPVPRQKLALSGNTGLGGVGISAPTLNINSNTNSGFLPPIAPNRLMFNPEPETLDPPKARPMDFDDDFDA